MSRLKHSSAIFLTSCVIIIGTSYETKAAFKKIRQANFFKRSSSTPNLSSSQVETPSTSRLSGSNSNLISSSTSSLNNPTKSPKNKFKNLFSKSSHSDKKEKPTYTVWDYIRRKPITTENFTQTPSTTFRDVGIQCEIIDSPKTAPKTQKSKFLGMFKKQDIKQTELLPKEQEQKISAKLTTYSHEYRELERNQIELIKLHQKALQKRLQEHLELLSPDSEQPSTSTSTSQNLQNAQVKLMERSLKIDELNEKVQDLKNIKTEISSINTILASIEPLKRETREEALTNETKIQGKTIQTSPKPSQPRKRLMKLKHLEE